MRIASYIAEYFDEELNKWMLAVPPTSYKWAKIGSEFYGDVFKTRIVFYSSK